MEQYRLCAGRLNKLIELLRQPHSLVLTDLPCHPLRQQLCFAFVAHFAVVADELAELQLHNLPTRVVEAEGRGAVVINAADLLKIE